MWMFEYLTKTDIINLKEFILNSINYLRWESGLKFEVAITEGVSWILINIYCILKVTLNLTTVSIEYYTLLA